MSRKRIPLPERHPWSDQVLCCCLAPCNTPAGYTWDLAISILKVCNGSALDTALCICGIFVFGSVVDHQHQYSCSSLSHDFYSSRSCPSSSPSHSFHSSISSCYWSASHSPRLTLILQVACGWHPHSIQHRYTHGPDPRRTSACTGQSLQESSLGHCAGQGLHVDSWKVFRHLEELWATPVWNIPKLRPKSHGLPVYPSVSPWELRNFGVISAFYAVIKARVPIWLQLDLAPILLRIGHHTWVKPKIWHFHLSRRASTL